MLRRPALPTFIPPQLSQPVKVPPEGSDWAHEIKHDGYRIHARLARGGVKLLTRTGLDWTDRYQTTAKALSKIKVQEAYLDGELCAVRPDGTTSFADLQAATDSRSTLDIVYFVFDLLFVNGKDLMGTPLLERKERLRALLGSAPRPIQYSHHHIGDGTRPTASSPTTLQLFLPKSTPTIRTSMASPLPMSTRSMLGERGGPFHKGGSRSKRLDARAAGATRKYTQLQMLRAVFFPSS
jgi:ATP-dependent DNA ligase